MIIKSYEVGKKNLSEMMIFVIYGENEGLKKDIIKIIKKNYPGEQITYDEAEIFNNKTEFYSQLKNKSLFGDKKKFVLQRCTEKISEILFEISENKIDDLIILMCGPLEKKSKLRIFAEKMNNIVIIPTYKDNVDSLINIAKKFFTEKNISISYETMSLLVSRCNGDRGYLKTDLKKISNYLIGKKIISLKEISTLTNLYENYSANELVDSSLAKNVKKTQDILNENNYSQEDTFIILRIFLQKTKRILDLLKSIKSEKDVEKVISEHRPPIFWKEKPIIKKQLQMWSFISINNLIQKINDAEIQIKKNNTLGLILLKNLIYEIIDLETSSSSLSNL